MVGFEYLGNVIFSTVSDVNSVGSMLGCKEDNIDIDNDTSLDSDLQPIDEMYRVWVMRMDDIDI